MEKSRPIGIFDSGIGGLSVLKQFIRFLPYESYVYLGDTARVPYGNKSADTVIEYSLQSADFLASQGVKLIVIACNTASSFALEKIQANFNIPVVGMIFPAAQAALRASRNNCIGVIGTRATISSKAYENTLKALSDDVEVKVITQSCPLFVPIVEEGWERHHASRLIAEEYLKKFDKKNIDTLVLGCTHYPMLHNLLSELMPGVSLIDSGEHAAVASVRILGEKGLLADERSEYSFTPKTEFYVTDIPAVFHELSKRFLGFEINQPKRIIL